MFRKFVAALALTVVVGGAWAEPSPVAPTPAVAPTAGPSAQAQNADAAFIAWAHRVMRALERANVASLPFLQTNYNIDPNDAEAALALLRQMSQQGVAARRELAAVRADLESISVFSHPGATADMVRVSNIVLRDSRASVENLDQLISDIIDFVAAIERRDEAEMARLAPRIDRGAVLLIQTQATSLRARQQILPATSSSYHAVGGMAAMYDGMAALMPVDADFDVAQIDAAASALDAALIGQRAGLFLERASVPASDPNHGLIMQVLDAREDFVRANERARDILRTASREAHAGASTDITRVEHIRVLGELEYEYQSISRRQIELTGRLAR